MATKITVIDVPDDDDDDQPDIPEPGPEGTVAKRSIPQIRFMEAQAIELAAKGASYRQIAEQLGYGSVSSAKKALDRGLARWARQDGDKAARLMQMRINMAYREVFEILAQDECMHTPGGKPLVNPITGAYVPDARRKLEAIDRLIALMEREAKLTGADMPSKRTNLNMGLDDLRAQAEELQKHFGVQGREDPRNRRIIEQFEDYEDGDDG